MLLYSVLLLTAAAIFLGVGLSIYRGRTELIHDYHRTRVTDKAAYGKAFGKAMFVIAGTMLLSGLLGLAERAAVAAVAVLLIGLCIGIGCIAAVQKKYNNGLF